jgi:hypothetical protein
MVMMVITLAKSLAEGRGRLVKQIAKRSSPCSQVLNSSLWPPKTEMSRFSAAIVANGNLTTVIAQAYGSGPNTSSRSYVTCAAAAVETNTSCILSSSGIGPPSGHLMQEERGGEGRSGQ